MKPLVVLLLSLTLVMTAACQKPDIHSQEALQDALAKYVQAIRKGDGEALYAIHSAPQQQQLAELRKQGFPPRKSFEFKFEGMLMRQQTAGVFGRYVENGTPGDDQALLFVLENGQWRLDRTLGSNAAIHRPAFAPPESGRFSVAGMPWQDVPARVLADEATGELSSQIQGAADESFLYLRLTYVAPLTAPDTALSDPVKGLPSLSPRRVNIAAPGTAGNFDLSFDTTTVSHFREGKNSYALGYDMALYGADGKFIFNSNAGSEEKLLLVGEREIVAKIPLESLAAAAATNLKIGVPQPAGKIELQVQQY